MATKTFGQDLNAKFKTYDEFVTELYELAGVNFPLQIKVEEGKILGIEYETEVKIGGTTPVEVVGEDGETTIDYKEDYEIVKLTKEQQDNIDAYIQANLKE